MGKAEPPSAVDALLYLGDVDFVQAAYWLLLGRDADAEGLATYTTLVRAGADKAQLILAIARSEEFRLRQQPVEGLEALEARVRPPDASRLGRVLNWLTGVEHRRSIEALECTLRAIDNRLYVIDSALRAPGQANQLQAAASGEMAGNPVDAGRFAALRQVPPAVQGLVDRMGHERTRRLET
jgi:hypothetical protein